MEQPQQQNHDQENGSKGGGNSSGGYSVCGRQSSTRWTPTTDQIRILKDLYYNNGVRSPTADQIQRISVKLRQYGKIEGKNVFYWFQNHKARERQKKRLFPSATTTANADPHFNHNMPIMHQRPQDCSNIDKKYYNTIPSGIPSASSSQGQGVLAVAQQMGSFGYGSVTMEKSFRDCSISAGGTSVSPKFGWVGMDPYSSPYALHDQKKSANYYDDDEEESEDDQGPEIETLPLFPMHAENINGFYNHQNQPESEMSGCYYSGWYCSGDGYGGSRTSLELSLNSYAGRARDST